jgi:hypothetical protein
MIKWLICKVWGHNAKFNMTNRAFGHDGNGNVISCFLPCKRCGKYKKIIGL